MTKVRFGHSLIEMKAYVDDLVQIIIVFVFWLIFVFGVVDVDVVVDEEVVNNGVVIVFQDMD